MSDIPSKAFERASWIRHQLRLRGTSFAAIGRQLGCTAQAVSMTAHYKPAMRIERALADALDLKVEQLFHERFAPGGRRLHAVRGEKHSRAA